MAKYLSSLAISFLKEAFFDNSCSMNFPLLKFAITMLTNKEEAFLIYWEKYRVRNKTLFYQFMYGLPLGMGMAVAIGLIYYTGLVWYKRAGMVDSQSSPWVLLIALASIAIFIAVMGKRFQWEQLEQRYMELKAKKAKKNDNEQLTVGS